MGRYFTAGEFAKLQGISKQTLIFYDKIGLIKPAHVDKSNGYRYYSANQLETLDTITMLKEIGAPLAEIRAYMEQRDVNRAIGILEEKKEDIKKKIKKQERIKNRLEAKLSQLNDAKTITEISRIKYENQRKRYIYAEKVALPNSSFDVDIAIKSMFEHVAKEKIEHNYQICTLVPLEKLRDKKFTEASIVYTLMDKKAKSPRCFVVESGLFASFYHKGAYKDTPDTYKRALAQIACDGYELMGGAYEECIVDNFTADREEDYLTKISIPVKKMI